MSEFSFDFGEDALKGKTILVAGGSGGLGSAAVALLAREGAEVVCGYHSNQERAEDLKDHCRRHYDAEIHLVQGDLRLPEVRERYLETAESVGGGLYGLVVYTGDPGRVKFDQVTLDDLHDSMTRNYYAPILLAREAANRMIEKETPGAIVFFSTMQAVAPFDSSINYAGPKTALIQAMRVMAKQWGGPQNIRVNAIAPGVNKAGMALKSIASGKYDFFVDEGIIPRFGRPEDTARAVRLLLHPDNYITGQLLTIDGGLTLRRDK
ncbi:MAG TPA: SDR family oxidoreductase [Acidobacteriota bacterium]|nr:SDR family oxidoreductase [Acidobacteriota bacterium]